MFGISGGEAILILVVALVVIGPERLPEYAEKLKDLIKSLKRYATGAKDDLKETLGPEFSDVDWRKLDPRQYDPRVIVREASWRTTNPRHRHIRPLRSRPPRSAGLNPASGLPSTRKHLSQHRVDCHQHRKRPVPQRCGPRVVLGRSVRGHHPRGVMPRRLPARLRPCSSIALATAHRCWAAGESGLAHTAGSPRSAPSRTVTSSGISPSNGTS